MRTITAPHRTLLGGSSLNFHARCEVQNATGTWINLSQDPVSGQDFFARLTFSEGIDQPVVSGTLELIREHRHQTLGVLSLAAMMASSPLNVDDTAAYSPLIHAGRAVRVSVAVTAPGVAPLGGDWHRVFDGYLDDPEWASGKNVISVPVRDRGGRIADCTIMQERQYGSAAGVPLEDVLLQMLVDNGFSTISIALPNGSPGQMLRPRPVARGGSLLDAMRGMALQIGWDLRYRYPAIGDDPELMLYAIDRTKSVADLTIPPSEYLRVTKMKIGVREVRNDGVLKYVDRATGLVGTVTKIDLASINAYGRQPIEIGEAHTSNIDTAAEAQAMLDDVIADLKDPLADHEIRTFYLWMVQLHDVVDFPANSVHYDNDQQFAVVGSQVEVRAGHMTQTLATRGKPAGAYREWINRHGLGPETAGGIPAPKFSPPVGEYSHGGGKTGDGMVWFGVEFDRNTAAIDVWAEEGPDDLTPTPDIAINSKSLRLTRQEGADSNAADWKTIVGIATRPGRWRTIRARGVGWNGELGVEWMPPAVEAVDPVPTPIDGTIASMTIATSALDTNVISVMPGTIDPGGGNWIIIRRNGVDIIPVFIDTDATIKHILDGPITPNTRYSYEAFIWNGGVSGLHYRAIAGLAAPPGITFAQSTPKLVFSGGFHQVAISWAITGMPTADNVVIEISLDGVLFIAMGNTSAASTVFLDPNLVAKWYRIRVRDAASNTLGYSNAAFFSGQGVPPSQGAVPPEWSPVPTARIIRDPAIPIGIPGLVMGFICATSGAATCAIQKAANAGGVPTGPWADVYESGRLAGDQWTGGTVSELAHYRLVARDALGVTLAMSNEQFWNGQVTVP